MIVKLTDELLTPEDLLALPDHKSYELVDGRLVERQMGWESSWIGAQINRRLNDYCAVHNLGWVAQSDAGYQCFPHRPKLVRKADVSFIRRGRLPGEQLPRGHCTIPPDLAVEVVSPNDEAEELEEKLTEYLGIGIPLIWVVYPRPRVVYVYRADGTVSRLTDTAELTGEDVLPGFVCPVRDLFPPPAPPPAP
jgi:Uma2 family endonuclease